MLSGGNQHAYITFGWVATIIGLLIFGALLNSSKSGEYQSSYYAKKCGELHPNSPFGVSKGALGAESTHAKDQGTSPDWCSLAAQQSAAEDSTFASRTAIASIVLTAAGMFLVWQTLVANQRATNAALDANEIARKQFLAEHRPWLDIETPDVAIYSDDGSDPITFVKVKANNFGKGPAIGVALHVKIDFPKMVLENTKAVDSFVKEITKPRTWRWGNTVIFPGNTPLLQTISDAVDNSQPRGGSGRLIVCATYRSSVSDGIFHTARAFKFAASAFNEVGEAGASVTEQLNVTYIPGSDAFG